MVQIVGKRLEQRHTVTIYYTTCDLRRGSDKINMNGRPYVIALSCNDSSHPYMHARVLGIYRVKVLHPTMAKPAIMDVLWVHWPQVDHTHRAGWKAKRLYRVKFVSSLEDGAFGFIDPDDVVRGAHFIPCFKEGWSPSATSVSKWDYAPKANWKYYYVNQWVACKRLKRSTRTWLANESTTRRKIVGPLTQGRRLQWTWMTLGVLILMVRGELNPPCKRAGEVGTVQTTTVRVAVTTAITTTTTTTMLHLRMDRDILPGPATPMIWTPMDAKAMRKSTD